MDRRNVNLERDERVIFELARRTDQFTASNTIDWNPKLCGDKILNGLGGGGSFTPANI